jgi:hypothetical protein
MNFQEFINSLNDEQKQAMMTAFGVDKNLLNPQPQEVKQKESPPQRVVGEDFKVIRDDNFSKGKIPVKAKKNEWHDDYQEHRDVHTPKTDRTPRNREKSKKVETECYVCGKTFYVDPRYVYGEYQRCNRCTGR